MARIPVVTRDQISEKEKHHERLQHVEAVESRRHDSRSVLGHHRTRDCDD
jgi:hypothetical protein